MRSEQLSPRKILHRGVRPLPVVIVLIAAIAIVLIALLTRRHDPPPPLPQSESLMPASENARLSTPVGDLTLPQGLTETCLLADASKESQYEMRVYEMVGRTRFYCLQSLLGKLEMGMYLAVRQMRPENRQRFGWTFMKLKGRTPGRRTSMRVSTGYRATSTT